MLGYRLGIKRRFLAAVAVLFLTSAISQAQEPTQSLSFETVQKNLVGAVEEDNNHVITDRVEWKKLWKLIYPRSIYHEFRPPLPEIDFTQNMIIAVFRGTAEPLDVEIKQLVRGEDMLTVMARETLPNPTCAYPPVVFRPYHIVVTERVKKKIRKNIRFEIEQILAPNCP